MLLPAYLNKAISIAKDLAINNTSNFKHRHGAVALYKKKVSGVGINTHTSSALQRLYSNKFYLCDAKYNHAEVSAVNSAHGILDTLIVVRVTKQGKLRNSKPCKVCMELLHDFGVKDIYYSSIDGTIQRIRVR